MAAVDELLPAGLGSAARQSRSSGWKSWVSFAEPLGINLADFSDHNRALWQPMYSHPGHSYKPGTLKTYASAIRSVITESGFPQPPGAGPMSRQFSRAVASLRPPRRPRKPITVPMLAKLKPHFDFSKQMDRSVWAITTVGVHAVCRLGELAPSTYEAAHYPRREDYRLIDQDGIRASEILLRRSKTDTLFKGVWVTVVRIVPGALLAAASTIAACADVSMPLWGTVTHTPLKSLSVLDRRRRISDVRMPS